MESLLCVADEVLVTIVCVILRDPFPAPTQSSQSHFAKLPQFKLTSYLFVNLTSRDFSIKNSFLAFFLAHCNC